MIHYITTNGIGNAWVANELRRVREAGIPFVLHTMRKPERTFFSAPWARRMHEQTRVIYPLPPMGLAVSVCLAPLLFGRRFFAALLNALFGKREHMRARIAGIAHLCVACHWARGLRRDHISDIHSQWIHSCGTIGMYGAWLLKAPFSFTGHAADLFRDRVALDDKVRRADFIVCISTFHRAFYLDHGASEQQLELVYCGIDPHLFAPGDAQRERVEPFRIVSTGRLVEKKGFAYLIQACRILKERGERFECAIGGSGPLEQPLRDQVRRLALEDRVRLTGQALDQEQIPRFMHDADLFCLPCVWSSDNDVDGLPQMLMEAMACGAPVISTRLVGIPDLVIDEQTGLLVEPNSERQLADAIGRIMHDPRLSQRLATAGRAHVLEKFDISNSLEPLFNRFRAKLNASGGANQRRRKTVSARCADATQSEGVI